MAVRTYTFFIEFAVWRAEQSHFLATRAGPVLAAAADRPKRAFYPFLAFSRRCAATSSIRDKLERRQAVLSTHKVHTADHRVSGR